MFVSSWILLLVVANVHGLGMTLLDGDVYIQFIGAIYSNSSCNTIETETVQNIQAIKWTLAKLNEANYIPNLDIGLKVSQTCKKEGEPEKLALQLATEMYNSSGKDVRIVGVIGADYSFETEGISRLISSLPEENRLLQGAYAATSASLRDRNVYKNFFRTIPPDDIQVEVMIEFMEALNWTYMAIIYDDDSYGRGGKEELVAQSKGLDVCFPVLIPVETTYSNGIKLATDIRDQIIGADVPISGVLVFGSSFLADLVLVSTEKVINSNENVIPPVFLFSEAGGYIQGRHTNISKGAFVLSPPRREISSFQKEWTDIFTDTTKLYQEVTSNALIGDFYKEIFNCSLAEAQGNNKCRQLTRSEFEETVPISVYNQYAIQTTLVFAKVIKNVFERKCLNNKICSKFLDTQETPRGEFLKELSSISEINFDNYGSFRDIEEFRDPDLIVNFLDSSEINLMGDFPRYEVYSHQICPGEIERTCLIKVAGYKRSKELDIISTAIKDYSNNGDVLLWPSIRKAQCPDGNLCTHCITGTSEESILFIPGDMYIVGVVPVHSKGSTPLECGEIKKGGLDIVETIRFAVKEAKSKPAAKIGLIIIDSCNDPQIIQEKVLTLHRFGVYVNGQYLPVGDKILGYIGGWSSDVSKAVAGIISRLKYPQISYASTAPVLSKRSIYPFFLRTPMPDNKQAETILKIVQSLGGNLIQIVHSEGAYGEGGRDLIIDYISTSKFDMCNAQSISFKTDSNGAYVLSKLRKFPKAKIVVLFLGSFDIVQLFDTFNTIVQNEFLFISTEGWGTRFDVGGYSKLVGSITVTSQLTVNEKLKDHVSLLKPDRSNANPWIRPYIEKEFDCYFQWSYDKTSKKKCNENYSLNVFTTDFRLDAWTPFAERGVTALLSGAETILEEKCDGNTTVLCDAFRKSAADMYEAVKKVEVRGSTGFKERIFDDNGDGIAELQIYVVSLEENGQYKQIGESSVVAGDDELTLTFQKSAFYEIHGGYINSTCSESIDVCNVCFPPKTKKGENSISAGFMAVLILLCVVCLVLVIVLVCICCRIGCCVEIDDGKLTWNEIYITPVYARRARCEDTYADIPSMPSGSEMLNIDGGRSNSERGTHNRLVGKSSQSTLGSDNGGYISGSSVGGSDTHSSLSRDQLTVGYNRDDKADNYINSDLNLREVVEQRYGPLPDPQAYMS